ncbi:hypothetical protein ABT354_33705 [Streptomyces sp. NPDC000594]|uniref:hypothetical protein n=1 Tax=Streptomyces sp. NPDC000594 TaxID=3154261 RepID=UPI0033228C55
MTTWRAPAGAPTGAPAGAQAGAPAGRKRWTKVSSWATVADGDRRICATCGAAVRSYQYRYHPFDSPMFERCVGLAWCPGCRIYSGSMVHVPRTRVLADPLATLPEDERERLLRSEVKLIAYLDGRADGA